jgi:hypothetical protein
MNKKTATSRLSKAAATEAIHKVKGNIWEDNWNPDANMTVTLTIDELRCATFLHTGRAPNWWLKPYKKNANKT